MNEDSTVVVSQPRRSMTVDRSAARRCQRLLAQAIEAEAETFLAAMADSGSPMAGPRRRTAWSERTVQTGIGRSRCGG